MDNNLIELYQKYEALQQLIKLIELYREYEALQQLINKPCPTLDEDFDIKKFYIKCNTFD